MVWGGGGGWLVDKVVANLLGKVEFVLVLLCITMCVRVFVCSMLYDIGKIAE